VNAHDHRHSHHEPASGGSLDALAFSATVHCLTGCAIGEVLGMAIGTRLGWADAPTIVSSPSRSRSCSGTP